MPDKDSVEQNNRILCVDDEKDIVEAYVDFLAAVPVAPQRKSTRSVGAASAAAAAAAPEAAPLPEKYEILKAYSGEEALEIVKKELAAGRPIAGGFFDVKMEGGIDGIRTIQEIWKLDPDVRCTIVTAYQDRSVQDIHQLFGDAHKDQWDYLNKPFNQGEIVQKARQMVAAWARKRNLESALKKLEQAQLALIQTERMVAIAQVARGVGHEFGNILQRVVGKADLMLHENDVEKIHENLKIILQAADRATLIVRNLQSFSRSTSERGPLELSKAIQETLSLVNHEFVKQSVELVNACQPGAKLQGSSSELQQVFMNLIINALHATPKGGKIEVGCAADGGQIRAWVKDTGAGIPPEVLPRIFDFAFTTKGEKGSGLGLSISKQIVEAHGGKIDVQSAVGKGTAFTVSFPMSK